MCTAVGTLLGIGSYSTPLLVEGVLYDTLGSYGVLLCTLEGYRCINSLLSVNHNYCKNLQLYKAGKPSLNNRVASGD